MKFIALVAAFVIIALAVPSRGHDWWERGSFYQIYPRSFKDSDGDGIGDLRGVIEKLDYLIELGISGAWLSPIFKSPMADFGYDISDYTVIQPEYGTNEDLIELVQKAAEKGLKIILDFVPNHTSDEHQWFIRSKANDSEYRDFYIWHPGKIDSAGNRQPPNNWVSVFRFSAWEWVEERKEYYLHQFAKKQPDLNYRNPAVVNAMKDILRFWLARGVAGFRIDAVPFLFEVPADKNGDYPDEPKSGDCDDPDSYCYLKHIYTQDRNETFDMAYQWRDVLNEFTNTSRGDTKIIMTEAYTSLDNIIRFYGQGTRNGSNIPFNFELISNMNMASTALDFRNSIHNFKDKVPSNKPANWVLGNHDNKRLASRFGVERIDLFNILLQTLPGVAVTYNGEELGMTDVYISWAQTVDPQGCNTNSTVFNEYSRDPARTPFQWDDTTSAGFSTNANTWLPAATNYTENNVKLQKSQARSHLKVFKALSELRKMAVMQDGTFEDKVYANNVYIYRRDLPGKDFVIVVLNFSSTHYILNLNTFFSSIPSPVKVVTASVHSKYRKGDQVRTTNVSASPNVGIVFYGTYV